MSFLKQSIISDVNLACTIVLVLSDEMDFLLFDWGFNVNRYIYSRTIRRRSYDPVDNPSAIFKNSLDPLSVRQLRLFATTANSFVKVLRGFNGIVAYNHTMVLSLFSKISTWIQRIFFGNFLYISRKGTEIRFCITGIICSHVQSALSTTH